MEYSTSQPGGGELVSEESLLADANEELQELIGEINRLRQEAIQSLTLAVLLLIVVAVGGIILGFHLSLLRNSRQIDAAAGSLPVLAAFWIWTLTRRAFRDFADANLTEELMAECKRVKREPSDAE